MQMLLPVLGRVKSKDLGFFLNSHGFFRWLYLAPALSSLPLVLCADGGASLDAEFRRAADVGGSWERLAQHKGRGMSALV